ncbi:DUF2752 domain-containing protein [Clostridium gasigenes]|uniref:DUF2752 domain-containing protein n=1 Tax=Clostridium gasigenes TaxID=94869 RepID=UPI001C0D2FA9|nr:DUF2752 domain-containing protein [Clostridium gasigenes]MBU3135419.1 DUF2752 domain-containing protein [Clostridium gasigenes]
MRKEYSIIRLCMYIMGVILIYLIPLSFVEGRSFCLFYNLFNITCMGCGISRGLFNIIHFNFNDAFNYNPSSFLWFTLLLLIIVDDLWKIMKVLISKKYKKYSVIEKITKVLIKSFKKTNREEIHLDDF